MINEKTNSDIKEIISTYTDGGVIQFKTHNGWIDIDINYPLWGTFEGNEDMFRLKNV